MSSSTNDLKAWDSASGEYAALVGTQDDSFWRRLAPFLARWMPPAGSRVLDVGCGHGWLADRIAAQGLDVIGVDGSQALVGRARALRPDLRFETHDLTAGLPDDLGDGFDLAVCHMVLMDMPTVSMLLADVARVLAPGGVMVSTILHPAFFRQQPVYEEPRHRQVTGYLEHEEWWVESFGGHRHYHRPLAWYVGQFAEAGMAVVDLDEPPTLPARARPEADWSDDERWFSSIPTMLSMTTVRLAP